MSVKSRNLFEDLGRPTLRGVRKCPKCGVYNGTRGLSCKNKECKLVFRKAKAKKKSTPDAVKIVSSSPLQIYSVKLQETEEDRTFVHLPTIEGIDTLQDAAEVSIIKRSAAVCYAPGCLKPVEDIGALQLNLFPCNHTDPIVSCMLEAQPLQLKGVEALKAPQLLKGQIVACLARAEEGEHLVQRVTQYVFVVRCEPDGQHPLGYLHFGLYEGSKKRFRILCGCQTQLTKPIVPREKHMCLHFYMIVCALASDSKLSSEFKPLLQTMLSSQPPADDLVESTPEAIELGEFFVEGDSLSLKKKKNSSMGSNQPFLLTEFKLLKTVKKEESAPNLSPSSNGISEDVSFSFDQWLSSVTERINQTMHYQFSGNPEPLVFQVPQVFFDILQQRLSVGSKKKRLPNSVVGFSVKDSLPMGVFSKYTWQITNIFHVKRIFDTPQVPLEITRSFIENRDGTYAPYQPLKDEEKDLAQNYRKTLNNLLIKPLELKTFLKVGNMTSDQKQPIPFTVEWIPDILPLTHVGEMRIKFEYGHQRNGVIEQRFIPPDELDDVILPD